MKKVRMIFAGVVAAALAVMSGRAAAESTRRIDVHTHLVAGELPSGIGAHGESRSGAGAADDARGRGRNRSGYQGRQSGQGRHRATQEEYDIAANRLIEALDRLGVDRAVVMPPPKTDENKGIMSEYDMYYAAVRKHQGRLLIGAGGESLNAMIHATDSAAVTAAILREFDRLAERAIAEGAKCFGEMAALHVSYSDKHVFEESPPDHPLFLRLADIAAERGIPIDLHMDCVPSDLATPEFWKNKSPKNPASLRGNVAGLERLLAHNRAAKIVWQHVGRDTLNGQSAALVRRLLSAHPNLYCAIWVRSRRMPPDRMPAGIHQIVDADYEVRDEWMELFNEYPDRFVVGTDGFFCSGTESLDESIESTWKFLDTLPENLRQAFGGENASRVYGIR